MHEINFVDESFDLKRASEYHLSIQLGLDGFSFCVLDILRKKYIAFRYIPLIIGKIQFLSRKVEAIFEQEENLNAIFQSVLILYSTNKATLIPKTYSNPEYNALFADLTNDISRNEETLTNRFPAFNYQVAYSLPKDLNQLFKRKFTDYRLIHKSVPFLTTALDQRNEKRNSILVNFEKNYILIIVIKGFQLTLFNSFYIKNELDFIYYTLNICQSQQIDPEQDEVIISGQVADDSVFIRQLKKYQHNISFLKPFNGYSYGPIFDKTQKNQFISLLNSYLCES